jgi:hypothetical protein
MLDKIQELNARRDQLLQDLEVSIGLNRLFGSKDKALTAGAYSVTIARWSVRNVFLTIRDSDVVKVFKFNLEDFKKSCFRHINIQVRQNHPYPDVKPEAI